MRNVLVTGGSSGIGRTTVERFALGGDRVWLTYRSGRQRGLDTVAELSAHGWQVEAFVARPGQLVEPRKPDRGASRPGRRAGQQRRGGFGDGAAVRARSGA
ncbi:MAG: SDR family NAD(P)-dependent oxidoreductase [Pseudonocardiaceae bacterium]